MRKKRREAGGSDDMNGNETFREGERFVSTAPLGMLGDPN